MDKIEISFSEILFDFYLLHSSSHYYYKIIIIHIIKYIIYNSWETENILVCHVYIIFNVFMNIVTHLIGTVGLIILLYLF